MKKLLYLFPSALLFVFCNNKSNGDMPTKTIQNGDVAITLIFENPEIIDTIWYGKSSYTVIDSPIYYREEGHFTDCKITPVKNIDTITIKSAATIYLNHSYGLNYANTYAIEPGDIVKFTYKDKIPYMEYISSGKTNNFNSIFNAKHPIEQDDMAFFLKNKRLKNNDDKKLDSVVKVKREALQLIYFDSLKGTNSISKIDYEINVAALKNKKKLESINNTDLLKDKYNLSLSSYTTFIRRVFEKKNKPALISYANGKVVDYKKQFNKVILLTPIATENKDYLLLYYLNNIALNFSIEDFQKYFQLFEKEVHDKSLVTYFKNSFPLLFDSRKLDKSTIQLLDVNNNKVTLEDLIIRNKGKVIYVDFWASWCTPCREAMPESHKLAQEFKDQDVVFAYLSIDTDIEKWKKAAVKEKIDLNGYSLLAVNYPNANFYKELQLKTIPRYLIYNKEGKLVNSNAPSPESKEVRSALNTYLK